MEDTGFGDGCSKHGWAGEADPSTTYGCAGPTPSLCPLVPLTLSAHPFAALSSMRNSELLFSELIVPGLKRFLTALVLMATSQHTLCTLHTRFVPGSLLGQLP